MTWRFSSPLIDRLDPQRRQQQDAFVRDMADATRTKSGWIMLLEASLFLIAAAAEVWLVHDTFATGSWQSGLTALLLFLLTFWPFIRHRIRAGVWP